MDEQTGLLETLRASGALKSGHFLLSSGRHSDQYIEKFDLLRNPAATVDACAKIADLFREAKIEVVAGPTTGGVILAFETARQLGVKAAYAERSPSNSLEREFRRGTTFKPGTRVLAVDDILTTGGSLHETLDALSLHRVSVAGVAVLVDRSGGKAELPTRWTALATIDATSWSPDECPLCAQGIALTKPGTTPTPDVNGDAQEPDAPG